MRPRNDHPNMLGAYLFASSCGRAVAIGCLLLAAASVAWADDWPMAGHDPQRTDRSPEYITGPFKYQWIRFFDEKATRAQVIVVGERAFLGTLHGSVIAMQVSDGKTLWQVKAGGPVYGSLASDGQRIFAACQDGQLYAFDPADGHLLWKYQGEHGAICHPLVVDDRVIYNDKGGTLYAVDAASGKLQWKYRAEMLAMGSPAAWKGKVFFGTEDMVAHAVDLQTGKGLWKAQMSGMSMQETWPVCAKDIVLFGTQPYDSDKVYPPVKEKLARHKPPASEEERAALEEEIVQQIRQNPAIRQTRYVFNIDTGREAFVAPFIHNTGRQGPAMPPAVAGDGNLWDRFFFTPLTAEDAANPRAFQYQCVHLIKMSAETGRFMSKPYRIGLLAHDETSTLSVAGETLFSNHWGDIGALDTITGWGNVMFCPGFVLQYDRSRGRYPGWMGSSMQNNALPASFSQRRFFVVTSSYVVCFQGTLGGRDAH